MNLRYIFSDLFKKQLRSLGFYLIILRQRHSDYVVKKYFSFGWRKYSFPT